MKIATQTYQKIIIILFLIVSIDNAQAQQNKRKNNYLEFKETKDLQKFFKYNDEEIIISGHRGGIDYPENSLEGLEAVLKHVPAIFEIDPRLTKDSVIVLMHDETLDRTTNATGKLSEYTWAELQSIRLKDVKGNITNYKIPTLEEVIIWSKGKTIINLDKKDVPMHMIAALIEKYKAEKHVMITTHTGAQARYYYDRFPNIMLSAFSRNEKEYEDLSISGVPWKNMIAYVGRTIDSKNEIIVKNLRNNGVKCMISLAPTHDKIKDISKRNALYKEEINKKPDIIESDLPIEVYQVLIKSK